MIMQLFIKEVLFPVLGCALCGIVGILIGFWLYDAISSISRVADALERVADALEDDGEEIEEEKKGGGK